MRSQVIAKRTLKPIDYFMEFPDLFFLHMGRDIVLESDQPSVCLVALGLIALNGHTRRLFFLPI